MPCPAHAKQHVSLGFPLVGTGSWSYNGDGHWPRRGLSRMWRAIFNVVTQNIWTTLRFDRVYYNVCPIKTAEWEAGKGEEGNLHYGGIMAGKAVSASSCSAGIEGENESGESSARHWENDWHSHSAMIRHHAAFIMLFYITRWIIFLSVQVCIQVHLVH